MRFIYCIWARGKEHARKISSELAVSVISIRKHMPDAEIIIYFADDKFGFFNRFCKKFNIEMKNIEPDSRGSLVTKAFCFLEALKVYHDFIMIDTDTIVNKDLSGISVDNLKFASYPKYSLFKAPGRVNDLLCKIYDMDEHIYRICSCVISVIKSNSKFSRRFWTKYEKSLRITLKIYEDRVAGNEDIRLPSMFNDEYYFTIAFKRADLKPGDFVFPNDIINSYGSDYLLHKRKASLKDKDIRHYEQCMVDAGVRPDFFDYPRKG